MKNNNSNLPQIDECRYLILKIIDQAVRDYLSLENSSAPIDQFYYDSACQFLFDDTYAIDYGGVDKTLKDLLDILDINSQWFRERVVKLKDKKMRNQWDKRNSNADDYEDDLEWY